MPLTLRKIPLGNLMNATNNRGVGDDRESGRSESPVGKFVFDYGEMRQVIYPFDARMS